MDFLLEYMPRVLCQVITQYYCGYHAPHRQVTTCGFIYLMGTKSLCYGQQTLCTYEVKKKSLITHYNVLDVGLMIFHSHPQPLNSFKGELSYQVHDRILERFTGNDVYFFDDSARIIPTPFTLTQIFQIHVLFDFTKPSYLTLQVAFNQGPWITLYQGKHLYQTEKSWMPFVVFNERFEVYPLP